MAGENSFRWIDDYREDLRRLQKKKRRITKTSSRWGIQKEMSRMYRLNKSTKKSRSSNVGSVA